MGQLSNKGGRGQRNREEIVLILMKMEWTEDHDIPLAKKVLISEHYRFKPRAV